MAKKISVTLHTLHAHVTCENLKEEFQCADILRSNRAAAAERPGGLAVRGISVTTGLVQVFCNLFI